MIRKIRVQRILIESMKEEDPVWIHISGQEVQYNASGEISSILPTNHFAHFTLDSAKGKMFDFFDPITETQEIHSGAGIASAVTSAALLALQEKYGGEIDGEFLCL